MNWWLILHGLLAVPIAVLGIARIARPSASKPQAKSDSRAALPSSDPFVFTRPFFIAGLIEGPYVSELPPAHGTRGGFSA